MGVIKDFKLPDLGEGLTESEVVSWRVAIGDAVAMNQIIAEVETAKALVELPSPFEGTIARLYVEPGSTVQVGTPIVAFEVDGGSAPDEPANDAGVGAAAPVDAETGPAEVAGTEVAGTEAGGTEAAGTEAAEKPAERNAVLVGYGPPVDTGAQPRRRTRAAARVAAPAFADNAAPSDSPSQSPSLEDTAPAEPAASAELRAERPRSTPPVRKLARDLGIELTQVVGTGEDGLITRADIQQFTAASSGAAVSGAAGPDAAAFGAAGDALGADAAESGATVGIRGARAAERETRTPIKGVRKQTAAAMVASAFTAPHVTEFLTVDVTPTMDLLTSLKSNRAFADFRVNMLTVVCKAICIAAARTPSVNSRWDEADGEIVTFGYVNLGIAVATPRGLMVPNIKDADRLTLTELSTEIAALAETARAGKTAPADFAGGTISLSNVGVFGVDAGTPILNPGEAAILAIGAIRRMPWEFRGEIALRQAMTLSLSFDHRLVDGEQGSRFLTDIGAILADPGMVLTMV